MKRSSCLDLPLGLEDLLRGNLEVLVPQVVQLAPKHVNVMSLYSKMCTVHSRCIMLVTEVVISNYLYLWTEVFRD